MEMAHRAPVVVATDGADRSAGPLRYGVGEARSRGVALRLVHVVPVAAVSDPMFGYAPELMQGMQAHGRQVLAEVVTTVRTMAPELDVEPVLAVGTRVHEIAEAAGTGQMVVLGRETRTGLQRLLTGATTAGVAGRSGVPAVVVPGDWLPVERGRVVVGIESEECAHELLGRAFARASQLGAQLIVIHSWDMPVPYSDVVDSRRYVREWRAAGARLLSTVLGEWRRACPDVAVATSVVHGQAAHALVATAEASDLLILGRRVRGRARRPHLGATARAVLRTSGTPVEVVPLGAKSVG